MAPMAAICYYSPISIIFGQNIRSIILRITGVFGTDILENKKVLHIKTCILTDCSWHCWWHINIV